MIIVPDISDYNYFFDNLYNNISKLSNKVKYDVIGTSYNETRCADSFILKRLIHHLSPVKGKLYIDIGCGTGNYTIALHSRAMNFIGMDPSTKMLEKGKTKSKDISWITGTAENKALKNNSLNGAIATLTIHHWNDLLMAFQNIYSILKPNSCFVIFTSTPEQMKGYWLNHYFPKMLEASIKQMPSYKLIKQNLGASGFRIEAVEIYTVKDDLQDLFLYSGKHRPKLYLDPSVRSGISSFTNLSNKDEVRQGLSQLQIDIKSGAIEHIINNYENENGDYLFIKAIK